MSRVLIIGAGGVGHVVAHKCAMLSETFTEISLASRTYSKCKDVAKSVKAFTGVDIVTYKVDANKLKPLISLMNEVQPDIVINVSQPYQNLTIMDACLKFGSHYLDTANYETLENPVFEYGPQWAYKEKFTKAGLTCILGCGFDPGVTGVFTRYISDLYLDEIKTIDIVDVNSSSNGHYFSTNFNAETNIREVSAPCKHYEDGIQITTPAMYTKSDFKCPEGVGNATVYRIHHEELESLQKHFPTLEKAQFWMSFGAQYLKSLEVLVNTGMTSIEPIEIKGKKISPLEFLSKVLPDPSTLGQRTIGHTCIGCIISGTKEGEPVTKYIYNIKNHKSAYQEIGSQGVSYTTGIPAVVGAKQVLDGTWNKSGVWNVEELSPTQFLQDLDENGLEWVVTDKIPTLEPKENKNRPKI